ncbi:methyl-accepting chemotaxis protein [Aestuariivirga sp.]|uniref:methyl-accepting chemotaxis protein n=1 Tax=Aestuariivirga sp. TaxID=2650926 RepID=UPI003919BD48
MTKSLFTIQRLMITFGVIMVGLMAFLGLQTYNTISEVRIGSKDYTSIVQGKDFVADILPPPLFPAEPFAYMQILESNPGLLPQLKPRLLSLHDAYNTRLKFWEDNIAGFGIIDPAEWTAFRSELMKRGEPFWNELENVFIPALERGDTASAGASINRVRATFVDFGEYMNGEAAKMGANVTKIEQSGIGTSESSLKFMTAINGSIAILIALLLIASHQFVVRALTRISATMGRLAGGHLEEEVPYATRGDEVGAMARALAVFKDQALQNRRNDENSKHIISVLGQGLENLAQGNLTHRIDQPFPDALDRLRQYFNSAADSLTETINTVKRGSFGIKSGTEEIAQASDNLSRRTENQAANLEETAAAVAEITSTVKKTAEGAQHARNMVTAAKEDADKSGVVVKRAVEAMQGIEKSSQEITQIIGVIDEIAFQTNLLALNAGVEAARAGEAGRGFAVVASEVRALAQRSAEAAKEIKGILSTSRNQVQEGVQLVAETGTSLRQIIERVNEINTIVTEIARSAEQQATGLQEVNTAVDQMDQVTQQNAAMVEEATAATRTLTQQSTELAQIVSRFTTAAAAIIAQAEEARETHKPAPRAPSRKMRAAAAAAAGGSGGGTAMAKAEPADAGWEEF